MIKTIALLVTFVTLLMVLAIGVAGPGARFGFWDFRMGFQIMTKVAPFLMGGLGLTLLALIVSVITKQSGVLVPAILALILGGAELGLLGSLRATAGEHPIHDITTDVNDPPAINAAADVPRSNPARYVGGDDFRDTGKTISALQGELYPAIKPQIFDQDRATIFAAALDIVQSAGWKVLAKSESAGTIEASYTSLWFGFIDDIVIRVAATQDEKTRVDVRSKSRVGGSDLGANSKRILMFQSKLQQKLAR